LTGGCAYGLVGLSAFESRRLCHGDRFTRVKMLEGTKIAYLSV